MTPKSKYGDCEAALLSLRLKWGMNPPGLFSMVDKPPIKEAVESGIERDSESVTDTLWWIPTYSCDACGGQCEERTEFVAEQGVPTEIWKCGECNARYYRE